jgi:hypothetical protein
VCVKVEEERPIIRVLARLVLVANLCTNFPNMFFQSTVFFSEYARSKVVARIRVMS